MRFFLGVIDEQRAAAAARRGDRPAGTASEAERGRIDAFNERLRHDDQWVCAYGIAGPDHAVTVDHRGESAELSAGSPLAGTDGSYLSGFWIIEAAGEAHARTLALDASAACGRRIELRPLLG